jgi:hypothetical protein
MRLGNCERFFVQADNVGATIDFHSCVLLLLLFAQFFSVAFFLQTVSPLQLTDKLRPVSFLREGRTRHLSDP